MYSLFLSDLDKKWEIMPNISAFIHCMWEIIWNQCQYFEFSHSLGRLSPLGLRFWASAMER
jgi:hypothetical protein